jgi:hypothetical protein
MASRLRLEERRVFGPLPALFSISHLGTLFVVSCQFHFLTLGRRLRRKAGFLLLCGVIPHRKVGKGVKRNLDIYLDLVLQEFSSLFHKGGNFFVLCLSLQLTKVSGFQVYDSLHEHDTISKVYVLFGTTDIRGFPLLNSQMSTPALNGACDQCEQEGVSEAKRTVYPGYFRFLLFVVKTGLRI